MSSGGAPCLQPNLLNSTIIVCTAPGGVRVGQYPVVVSLNGQNSSGSVTLDRLCGDQRFGVPGAVCGACPKVREEGGRSLASHGYTGVIWEWRSPVCVTIAGAVHFVIYFRYITAHQQYIRSNT